RSGAMSTLCNDERASLLASATDLLNSWAREMGVHEAQTEADIKPVIDRLWSTLSIQLFSDKHYETTGFIKHRAPETESYGEHDCCGCIRVEITAMGAVAKRVCNE